jgi:hypothetical protein
MKPKKTKIQEKSKQIFLKENFVFDMKNVKNILNESLDVSNLDNYNDALVLSGIIQRCNTLNQNGRVYPRNVLVPKLQHYIKTKVETGMAYGELDHKDSEVVEFKNAAFRFRKIWIEEDVVYGEIVIFPGTEEDKKIRGALKTGGKIGISSRAMGSVSRQTLPEGIVADVVGDDLHIICWDIVTEPSTPKAFMEEKKSSDQNQKSVKIKTSLASMNENKNLKKEDYNNLLEMVKKFNKKES